MMRLLFLCLLLLLPASAADISDLEGSADVPDDEELEMEREASIKNLDSNPGTGKNTGVDENRDEGYMIIIVIAGVVLALSVVAVVTILIVKRKMQQREQGIYTVPVEQDHKGPV